MAESTTSPGPATPEPMSSRADAGLLQSYGDLVKIRLSMLVVVTAGVGVIMASGPDLDWWTLFWTVTGTLLCASAANAFNQVLERRRDALMDRTRDRPLPGGRLSVLHGWVVAMILTYAGLAILAMLVNLMAAGLALLTLLLYVLAYTPLKPLSTINTLIGAVVGAIPPLIGWIAVRDTIDLGGWVLASILFLWQIPHFLSLAWIYRSEYEAAGFRMLPSARGGERAVCESTLFSTLLLIPLSLQMVSLQLVGLFYACCAFLVGAWFSWRAFGFFRNRNATTARQTFLASLMYLPILLLAMILDRIPMVFWIGHEASP